MDTDAFAISLERIDGRRNMARFYQLSVEIDLFGHVVSVRRWGRIGSHGRQVKALQRSVADALSEIQRRADDKRRRGYHDVEPWRSRVTAETTCLAGCCGAGEPDFAANGVMRSNGGNTEGDTRQTRTKSRQKFIPIG